ncbi:MAG: site-specific DNA-methyltransferase [Armatimonadetes bacterium]|nr:site-specific DNA-methyltransferase [Armatimonadota bacterium]
MPKRPFVNRLNDLARRDWLLFQKSWFVHNPPPRSADVRLHPAKFPETLAGEFIGFFTKAGETVLDPMMGTGSALVAALEMGRRAVGVELQPKYAAIAQERLAAVGAPDYRVVCDDARNLAAHDIGEVDYVLTSPPYWDMLRMKGWETQKERAQQGLDVHYSDDERDVGNIEDYERFLEELVPIYRVAAEHLRPKRYLTIIVKNVKKGGTIYPLAWDLGRRVGEFLALKDERIWCQDNQRLAPYGMGNAWVSNTMHHYCLQFRKA